MFLNTSNLPRHRRRHRTLSSGLNETVLYLTFHARKRNALH